MLNKVNQTNRRLYDDGDDDDDVSSGNRSNGMKMSISTPSQGLLVVMEQRCPIGRLQCKRRIRDLMV
jgi:hypothetical protein